MSTGLANRIAALGYYAISIGEISGDAAARLLEAGARSPIGSGHPIESFTVCGVGMAQHLFNSMMPPNAQMRVNIQFEQPEPPQPKWYRIAQWDNDSGDRHVVTVYVPDRRIFLTACVGSPEMKRPIQSRTSTEAKLAHSTLIAMVEAGQL